MYMTLPFVSFLLAILFVISGFIFSRGKGTNLLAVFVMLTPQERKEMDLKALCKLLSPVMYIYALGFVIMILFTQFHLTVFFWIAIAIFVYGISRSMRILKDAKENLKKE